MIALLQALAVAAVILSLASIALAILAMNAEPIVKWAYDRSRDNNILAKAVRPIGSK